MICKNCHMLSILTVRSRNVWSSSSAIEVFLNAIIFLLSNESIAKSMVVYIIFSIFLMISCCNRWSKKFCCLNKLVCHCTHTHTRTHIQQLINKTSCIEIYLKWLIWYIYIYKQMSHDGRVFVIGKASVKRILKMIKSWSLKLMKAD